MTKADSVEEAAATVAVVGAVSGGKHKNPMDKYKKRLRRMKIATAVLLLIFIIFMAVGITLLVFFVPKWDKYPHKGVAITGIVFVGLAFLILLAFVIAIVILCKLYNSLSGGTSYHPPKDLTGVKYPRQADYDSVPTAEPK